MTRPIPEFEPAFDPMDAGSGTTNRRTVIKAGATALGLGAVGLSGLKVLAQETPTPSTASSAASPTSCVLTTELTEGPYYVADLLVRKNIVEDKAGLPLTLRIAVQDTTSCAPLAKAAVDIWHCDARGYYSGISGENPGDGTPTGDENLTTTFLRGVQLTDSSGVAEFETIYPGWYTGRTIHIHMKVHDEGTVNGDTYDGGHVSHTGQLFFDDAITEQVLQTDAYAGRNDSQRTLNTQDNILDDHADEPGFMVELTPVTAGTITVGVDPSATPTATGPGGGGQGGPPPSGGNGRPPGGPNATSTPTS